MASGARHRIHKDELHAALEQVLSQYFKRRRRIKKLRRRLSVYSSSYTIENLEVELDRGQRLRLVLKDLSPASLLVTAQQVRPDFLYKPMREIETYRKILQPLHFGTPTCYGATDNPEFEKYWLFLERVSGPLLWQTGQMDLWEKAARWLARLHLEFDTTIHSKRQARLAHLLRYDEPFYKIWLTRAEGFLHRKFAGDRPDIWRQFARLAGRYDKVIKRLLELPTTFIHGEFYPSNVIIRRSGQGREICPIDWEVAAVAPGVVDLAALTLGEWTEGERNRMITAYRENLEPTKGWPPSMADLLEAVDCCQLHICVQWLGWAPDWSPPKRHAQNWLREAFRLAKKLGI